MTRRYAGLSDDRARTETAFENLWVSKLRDVTRFMSRYTPDGTIVPEIVTGIEMAHADAGLFALQ